ncbi:MAG: DbpA RNA binding domain-containing protein [Ruminococcus sp.]|nr:DbpA RNA binding domain-containing protein [Ruminococcus sp.]
MNIYIHRIGRTGRAGRAGVAYTLVSGKRQVYELKNIARYTNSEITELPLPEKSDIIAMKKESVFSEIMGSEANTSDDAYDMIERLEAAGIDSKELAARLISDRIQAEIASLLEFNIPRPLKKSRRSNAKTVKVDISIGRNKRVAPNFILGALVDATGMPGRDFGKIDIFDNHTTVEIPESESDYVIDAMNSTKINGHQVEARLYNGGAADKSRPTPKGKDRYNERRKKFGGNKNSDRRHDYMPDRKKRVKKRH